MAPLLPTIQEHFKHVPHSEILVPLLLTTPALCIALLSPLAGMASDQFGPRRLLLWSLGVYSIAGTAPMYLQSLPSIFASRLLVGVAEAGALISSMALLSHYFAGDARQKWFAYQNVVLPLLAALILTVTGRLGDFSWRATFMMYAIGALMWILALVFLHEIPHELMRGRLIRFPPLRHLLPIIVIAVPGSIAFYAAPIELSYLLRRHGFELPSVSANVTAVGLVLGPLGALVSRRLTHWSVGKVVSLAMLAMGIGLATMAVGARMPIIACGLILQQMGGSLMITTGSTFAVGLASPEDRGVFSGAWWFCYMMAQFAAPLFLTALLAITNDQSATVLTAGALAGVSCAWLLTWRVFGNAVVSPETPAALAH